MNNNKRKHDIGVWLLFIAVFFIAIFFLWYFFIYVNGREKVEIQKSFRALTQLGENFRSRYKSYGNIITSTDMGTLLTRNDTSKNFKQRNKEIKKLFFGLEVAKEKDSLDNNYIYFRKSGSLIKKKIKYTENEKTQDDSVIFCMNKEEFFKPIERRDVFDDIVFIRQTPNGKDYESFYSSYTGDIEVNKLDSLTKTFRGISSGSVAETKISGINYKLFITKLKLGTGLNYYIGGLINKETYVKETRAINYFLALIIVFIFIIFLLSIPLFKLKMTGENQELKIYDLIFPTLSILAGTSFVLLVILSILGYLRNNNNIDSSLEALSDSVKTSFIGEIDKINTTLDLFGSDSLIVKGRLRSAGPNKIKLGRSDLVNINSSTCVGINDTTFITLNDSTKVRRNYLSNTGDARFNSIRLGSIIYIKSKNKSYSRLNGSTFLRLNNNAYRYFKLIFDLDEKGDQKFIISSRQKESSLDNYSYRKYFIESGEWNLDGENIMLDFIISSTSGEQLGVVSKRKGNRVLVITSRMTSVLNTIMPAGYGFCIIDDKGDVKFHSDSERMLRENILAETEHSRELANAIYSNKETYFTSKYLGRDHSFYIQPIRSLPLHIVTFFNNSYSNSVNVQATGNSFMFLFALLLIFAFLMIGSKVVDYRKTELKRNFDLVDFLRPSDFKLLVYKKMIFTNAFAVIMIIVSSLLTTPGSLIFLIFLFVVIQLSVANYYTGYMSYKLNAKPYLFGNLVISIFLIAVIYYLAIRVDAEIEYLIVSPILLILIDYAVIFLYKLKSEKKSALNPGNPHPGYFYYYLFSWICLMVVTPVIIFYILMFNYETKLDLTRTLHTYVKEEAARSYAIDEFYHDYIKNSFYAFKEGRKSKGIYLLSGISRSGEPIDSGSGLSSMDKMIISNRTSLDKLSRERGSLVKEQSPGVNEHIIKSGDSVYLEYKMPQVHYSAAGSPHRIYYSGIADSFGFNTPELFIFTLIVFSLILFTVYKIIKFTSDRIFGLSIEKRKDLKYLLACGEASGNNLIIHQSNLCEGYIEKYKSRKNCIVIDYNATGPMGYDSLAEKASQIIIDKIEPDFGRPEKDAEKLTSIINIGERIDRQVFLIVDSSIEKLKEICEIKMKSEKNDYRLKHLNALKSVLEEIDRKYDHIYFPQIGEAIKGNRKYLEERLAKVNISGHAKKTIIDELSVLTIQSSLIRAYAEQVIKFAELNNGDKYLPEKITVKIQDTAKGYYESIWESCTKDEKLLLDDISDNLLLNDKNKRVIEILLAKGLLKKNVSVSLANNSFRNYVNSKADGEQEKEYLEVRKSGNWTRYRAPLILILFAVAFFIVLQENILSNIYSIMTLILGIMTVVTKISGIFSTGNMFKPASGEGGG